LAALLERADPQRACFGIVRRGGVDGCTAIRAEGVGALVTALGGFDIDLGLSRPQDERLRGRLHVDAIGRVKAPQDIGYRNVFRVLIMAFIDAVNYDVRAMKKSCVHVVQPGGRIIPFEAFNLLYRDDRTKVLAARRREIDTLYRRAPSPMDEG
jgi:hypothetical protein